MTEHTAEWHALHDEIDRWANRKHTGYAGIDREDHYALTERECGGLMDVATQAIALGYVELAAQAYSVAHNAIDELPRLMNPKTNTPLPDAELDRVAALEGAVSRQYTDIVRRGATEAAVA